MMRQYAEIRAVFWCIIRLTSASPTRPRRWSASQRKNTEKNCAAAMRQAIVEQFGESVSPLPHREPHPQPKGATQRAIEKIPPQLAQAAAIASDIGRRVGLHECAYQIV